MRYRLYYWTFAITVTLILLTFIPALIKNKALSKYHQSWSSIVSLPRYILDTNVQLFPRKISPVCLSAQNSFFNSIYEQCGFYHHDYETIKYICSQYTEYFIHTGHIKENMLDDLMVFLFRHGILSCISYDTSLASDPSESEKYMRQCEYFILQNILKFMDNTGVGFLPDRMMLRRIEGALPDPRFSEEQTPFSYIFNLNDKHKLWKNKAISRPK